MKINKTGYYKLNENRDEDIFIGDNINVFLYDEDNFVKNIKIGNNSKVEYYSYFSKDGNYEKNIVVSGNKSEVKIKSLLLSKDNRLDVKIYGEIKGNSSLIDTKVLSLAGENGDINLDGILKINSGTKGGVGYLNEENIFLGKKSKISGIPTLLIETNEVSASHSCSIEKVGDEKLFYLRSRGIDKKDSFHMLISAKIKDLFRCLDMVDKKLFSNLSTLKKSSF
ncbi:hypothetical protein CSB08_00220 [Candidatus Gracilibacteria bacterium]|nr:MAG: hypothetical protein CSB08_00220 [Candidatus Gracilibacteria bacterium]PIE85269.1 MAG: hypothetical protein CSA08_02570 [Candidatus Gracilibacteria bacterium]